MKVLSKKPGKQRKYVYNAPHHRFSKLMSAHLSPELREKYGRRSFPVRKGDTVKILVGEFKGIEGKVTGVNREKQAVYVENVTIKRADGRVKPRPIHASNVIITSLNLEDKYRKQALEAKQTKGG